MRKSLMITAAMVMLAGTAMATDWQRKDLVGAEDLLDGYCRGVVTPDDADVQLACDARDKIYKALYKDGWCLGKNGQPESEKHWHKCGKNSIRDNQ
jgi:hypothetical protein